MFQKILIANRGEIACRVIKTARKMDIRTVAVYSEADRRALHVSLADEALPIGPAPASHSYLAAEKILHACRDSGADAVHPGYGFLSENAAFAERLGEVGIVFIGPPPRAITHLGDKVSSKRLARQAGVDTIPGGTDILRDADHAVEAARDVGYPVMLKATAGGGGKGLRVARDDAECRHAFARASNEADLSFRDSRLFVERFIEEPRHIEIQVLADRHGNVIHLGERECSVQRRYQKIVEEAPSPFLDGPTRAAMGQQAVALARAVEYQSAGTVEFIVDADRNFYFLEMNTRLQVEHPVTECVCGVDLVELMIRIAAGEPLPFSQSDVRHDGWSMEARVYAEDPVRGFLPSAGRLVRYMPPPESESIRVDSGVYEGGEMSLQYDPLIAKVISHSATRQGAIAHLRSALDQFCIRGVSHNVSFLTALLQRSRFCEGQFNLNFIAEEFPTGFDPAQATREDPALLIAVAAAIYQRHDHRDSRISGQLPEYQPEPDPYNRVVVTGGQHHDVGVRPSQGALDVDYRGKNYRILSEWQIGQPLFRGTVNGTPVCLQIERTGTKYRLVHGGREVDVAVLSSQAAKLLRHMPSKPSSHGSNHLRSPMPGLLTHVNVDVGHEFKRGQHLAVVEAMKMENVLSADRDGKVVRLLAAVGETLTVDQPILEFE